MAAFTLQFLKGGYYCNFNENSLENTVGKQKSFLNWETMYYLRFCSKDQKIANSPFTLKQLLQQLPAKNYNNIQYNFLASELMIMLAIKKCICQIMIKVNAS